MNPTPILALFNLGGWELIVLGVLGLLIFGKRLPEVGRSLGKGLVEFKKGLAGVDEEVNRAGTTNTASQPPRQIAPNDASETTIESREEANTKAGH